MVYSGFFTNFCFYVQGFHLGLFENLFLLKALFSLSSE